MSYHASNSVLHFIENSSFKALLSSQCLKQNLNNETMSLTCCNEQAGGHSAEIAMKCELGLQLKKLGTSIC